MDKLKAIEALAAHALITLPDSRSTSLQLLNHICTALPKDNEVRIEAQGMLRLLGEAEKAQTEFFLNWKGQS